MLKNTLFILFISIVTTACVSNKMSKYLDRHSKSKTTVSKKIPKMYPVSANVYRVQTSKERLWQETLRVLSKDYGFEKMDIQAKAIVTNFDYFSHEDQEFKNRIEAKIRKVAGGFAEIEIKNTLWGRDHSENWVVNENEVITGGELARVVQNLAYELNITKPVLPKNLVRHLDQLKRSKL